jgi:hypothetical protein
MESGIFCQGQSDRFCLKYGPGKSFRGLVAMTSAKFGKMTI